jgi:hypothetical protein
VIYNPTNWYWVVAGNSTTVWSSAALAYVPLANSTYVAWLAAGNVATHINSTSDLYGVMAAQVVPDLMGAGVSVTSTGTPALNGTYALDPVSQAQITAIAAGVAAGKGLPGGGGTFNWPTAAGALVAFSSANFLNFATALETFLYNFNQALMALTAGGVATLPSTSITIA